MIACKCKDYIEMLYIFVRTCSIMQTLARFLCGWGIICSVHKRYMYVSDMIFRTYFKETEYDANICFMLHHELICKSIKCRQISVYTHVNTQSVAHTF